MGDKTTWLMPDFGFWAWPEPGVGSYVKVQQEAREMEQGAPVPRDVLEAVSSNETATMYTWANKIPKLVWRGATYINEHQRMQLMDVARDQPWADVKDIVWTGPGKPPANLLSVNEFCKYKYIMYGMYEICRVGIYPPFIREFSNVIECLVKSLSPQNFQISFVKF